MKTGRQGFFLDTSEELMKKWPGGSHLFMKSAPRVPGDKTILAIIYRYISQKVLGFISTEGDGITKPGLSYLSHYPENI